MAQISWLSGVFGDWTNAALWSGGVVPGSADTVTIGAGGTYDVTLFSQASVSSLIIKSAGATFYDAGSLALGGTLSLQSGTLALAYGAISGGVLALAGGSFLAGGGTLAGVTVQGALGLQQGQATLFIRSGLTLTGAGGSGAGSIALTGSGAALDFIGSQSLNAATIDIGATAGQGPAASLGVVHDGTAQTGTAGTAQTGATLTLGAALWLRDLAGSGVLSIGASTAGTLASLPDLLVSKGTMTVSGPGSSLLITGSGTFSNQGSLAVANGATLTLAIAGFANSGTMTVSSATLALAGTFAASRLGGLGALTLSNGTVAVTGTADNRAGTLTLGAGTVIGAALGQISLAGTLLGGVVQDGGGGLGFGPGSGVLDSVTYQGVLDLSSGGAVTLADGSSIVSAGGAGIASILDTGAGSALLLRGNQTLDNATVVLGNAGQAAMLGTADAWLASAATTATLGANLTIQQAGALAAIDANGSGLAGFGLDDTLVAAGLIAGAIKGGTLSLGGFGTLINQGTIAISSGDTLSVSAAVFSNTGTILVSSGATAILGASQGGFGMPAPFWSNTGQIIVSGGTLVLAGTTTTAQLGQISVTGGTVAVTGTLANAGATLTLGAGGLPGLSLAGTIAGGTIIDSRGLSAAATGTGVLDGVTYQGILALSAPGALLRVRDGLTVNGTLIVNGAGADLAFWGSQELDGPRLQLGAAGSAAVIDVQHDYKAAQGSTLTLGAGLLVVQSGTNAAIGLASDNPNDAIVNTGTIRAATTGGLLTLGGADFSNQGTITVSNGDTLAITAAAFSNGGVIAVSGAALSIGGSMTLAELGNVSLSNAALAVAGTLDMAGTTLALGAGSGFGHIALTGTLANGTIADAGGGLAVSGAAAFDAITYQGTLDLSRPFAQLAISGGLTLTDVTGAQPGTLMLTGAQARVVVTDSETIDHAVINLGSAGVLYLGLKIPPAELAAGPGATLTLGTNATLSQVGSFGILGDAGIGQWTDSIVNNGRIISAALAGTLVIDASFFTNNATVTLAAGASLQAQNVGFTNAGTLTISQTGSFVVSLYDYFAAPNPGASVFTNTGTIAMLGGLFQEVTSNGLFPAVPFINAAGALIKGSGILSAQVANQGTIEASGGVLALYSPVTGSGTILIDPGAALNPTGGTPAGDVITFAKTPAGAVGGTLVILNLATFSGAIAGFGAGDIIDLATSQLTGIAISNGTLVANTATLTERFITPGGLGGEVSVGRDKFGGSTIAITPQTLGGASATIAVTQPAMLFWGAPAGDIFQGATAMLNGARISNWVNADQLDFTDLLKAHATLAYTPQSGYGLLNLSDGTHSATVTLFGTFTAQFHHRRRWPRRHHDQLPCLVFSAGPQRRAQGAGIDRPMRLFLPDTP